MSAFIVEPSCINCIVTYLHDNPDYFEWLKTDLGCDVSRREDLAALAQALYDMNRAAVVARYGKTRLGESPEAFPFHLVRRDPVQVHKAIDCLHYQCSEGDVPDQPLYAALAKFANVVANRVVTELPAYDCAPWGS